MSEPASDDLIAHYDECAQDITFLFTASEAKRLIARIRQQDITLRIHDAEVDLLDERIAEKDTEIERLREAAISTTASLVAAVSLLKRGSKKAAPSDVMFDLMIADYEVSIERARAALKGGEA